MKRLNVLGRMNEKGNRPARKLVNSFAKKYTTFEKESTELDRPNRPLLSAYPRPAAPE
jgi:hypothetical protein